MSTHFLDIIYVLFPIIPSFISICFIICQNDRKTICKPPIGYEIILILMGFAFFPANEYVGIITGVFVCCVIYLNCIRTQHGKQFGGLLFPSIFFFNLTSFSGVNIYENLMMVIYAIVGGIYIIGFVNEKENNNTDFLKKWENLCIIISAIVFVIIKIIFLFLTDNLLIL